MKSLYLLGISLLGGVIAVFGSAGWSSYKHQKIPERAVLFRWFVAGVLSLGLSAYVWIFGANGDFSYIMNHVNGVFDLTSIVKLVSVGTLAATATSSSESTDESTVLSSESSPSHDTAELTVGMPAF